MPFAPVWNSLWLIRLLDEDEKITDYMKQVSPARSFGTIYRPDGTTDLLPLRELANKIIHAGRLEWDLSDPNNLKLVCHATEDQQARHRWRRADAEIVALAAFCGGLMS